MATVRFSTELVDQIISNAKHKMMPPVTKAIESRPEQAWGQYIYDTLFGGLQQLLIQLPPGWVRTTKEIKIAKVGIHRCDMTFALNTSQPWPYQFPDMDLARKDGSWGEDLVLKQADEWAAFEAEVVAYNQRVFEARRRQAEFVEMVKAVIIAYSTLAPALKAWPPLWELVPENYKNKHREIKERVKSEVKLDVDLNKLTAMSTAAKFGI